MTGRPFIQWEAYQYPKRMCVFQLLEKYSAFQVLSVCVFQLLEIKYSAFQVFSVCVFQLLEKYGAFQVFSLRHYPSARDLVLWSTADRSRGVATSSARIKVGNGKCRGSTHTSG